MSLKTFFISLFFLGSPLLIFSQEKNPEGDIQLLDDKEENLNLLTSPQTTFSAMGNNPGPSNEVYIMQIGEANSIYTTVSSPNAIVNLKQNGSNNQILMDVEADVVRENILQEGNGNYALDNVQGTNLPVSLDLIQEGDNLRFERHGVNSTTNELKIRQTEGSGSSGLIIRSF